MNFHNHNYTMTHCVGVSVVPSHESFMITYTYFSKLGIKVHLEVNLYKLVANLDFNTVKPYKWLILEPIKSNLLLY